MDDIDHIIRYVMSKLGKRGGNKNSPAQQAARRANAAKATAGRRARANDRRALGIPEVPTQRQLDARRRNAAVMRAARALKVAERRRLKAQSYKSITVQVPPGLTITPELPAIS